MIQNIIRNLGGIDHYGVLSLCLFSTIFLGVFLWACFLRKNHLDRMARIPLDTEPEQPHTSDNSHE